MPMTLDDYASGIAQHVSMTAYRAENGDEDVTDATEVNWAPTAADLADERVMDADISNLLDVIEDYDGDRKHVTDLVFIGNHRDGSGSLKPAIRDAASTAVFYETLDRLEGIGLHDSDDE